jgi:hypothetical protein
MLDTQKEGTATYFPAKGTIVDEVEVSAVSLVGVVEGRACLVRNNDALLSSRYIAVQLLESLFFMQNLHR